MKFSIMSYCLILLTAGCAALDPSDVRDLTTRELAAFNALDDRLQANRAHMSGASETLGELGASWAEKAFELERAMAKAQRLESMQAPWSSPEDELVKTQRAVVLYHLYEVEMAEQKVLDVRMAERRAAARELAVAYDRFADLLDDASDNLGIVLKYLNQPRSAQIKAFTSTFLAETAAFRQQLQQSENPRLQSLAGDVARHEAAALAIKQQANEALQTYFRLKELGE